MIHFPDTAEQFYQQTQVCQFGITEAIGGLLGAFGIGDLFAGGAAAADIGAGAATAADLGALAAPGAALGAPTAALGAGLESAAFPLAESAGFGAGADAAAAAAAGTGLASGLDLGPISLLAGTGADVAGTAGAALAAPAAELGSLAGGIGFGTAADLAAASAGATGLAGGIGGILPATAATDAFLASTPVAAGIGAQSIGGALPSLFATPSSGVLPSSASAFAPTADVGTTGTAGLGAGFQPGTAGAASVSAPASVAGTPDATAALAGGSQIPGAAGPTSVGGAPLAGGTAGAPSSSIGQILSKLSPSSLASGAVESIAKNPLGIALGAGGLGYSILQGQKQTANEKALQADAAQATQNSNVLFNQSQALQQYLTSGTLPPQYMQQVTNAINDAITSAKSNAAAQGQSTDPTTNSVLAQQIESIKNQEPAMISQVAGQLFSSGSSLLAAGQSAAGLSGQLYQALVQNDTTQAANIGKAIASLAAALNGRSQATLGGTNITLSPA